MTNEDIEADDYILNYSVSDEAMEDAAGHQRLPLKDTLEINSCTIASQTKCNCYKFD